MLETDEILFIIAGSAFLICFPADFVGAAVTLSFFCEAAVPLSVIDPFLLNKGLVGSKSETLLRASEEIWRVDPLELTLFVKTFDLRVVAF